jgi:carboxyl-terminal processing protease
MKIYKYIYLFIIAFISCQNQNSIPKEVSDYLSESINLLEQKSIRKNEINWEEFKSDIFKKAQNAKTINDAYPIIKYAISKLNDRHSYFRSIIETDTDSENNPLPVLSDEVTPKDIGYIRIPFCIGTEKDYDTYISKIRNKIDSQSNQNLQGWIIDLRGNFGGNMWPMLLSLEPILGNGTFGYFIDADGK